MVTKLAPLPWATLPEMLDANAALYGDKVALIEGEVKLTYRALSERVETAARALVGAGVAAGDNVAICLPNGWKWAVCAFAIWKAGAVVVPVNTRFKSTEMGHMLHLVEPSLVLMVDEFLGNPLGEHLDAALAQLSADGFSSPRMVDCGDHDHGWSSFLREGETTDGATVAERCRNVSGTSLSDIMLTSGTTGFPKGVMANQSQDIRAFYNLGQVQQMSDQDVLGIALPFFHTFGFKAGLLLSIMYGATICVFDRYDPTRFLQSIQDHGITFIPGPPPIFNGLLDHPDRDNYDLRSLRLAVVGSAFVPPRLVDRLVQELNVEIQSSYGLTEATGVVSGCRAGDPIEANLNSIGQPQPEVEVRIMVGDRPASEGEVGEIQARGYNVTAGYYKDPQMSAQIMTPDGWLKTGDLGAWRHDGNIAFRGRMKEMLIIGGFNVYPLEIENCLRQNPDVVDAAVIAAPDERLGEVPAAFVVLCEGAMATPDQLQAWVNERIANYKVPKIWRMVEALPTNASGKVTKGELAALLD